MPRAMGEILLFSLKGHQDPLAVSISRRLNVPLAALEAGFFRNRETSIQIDVSVRGKDVYIIQVIEDDPNDAIMQLLITTYALKTSCARRCIGVVPYLPYSKQSKMRNRGSIPAKLMATMFCRAGIDHVITMDLHSKEIQGFYDCPVENLRASPFIVQHIQKNVPDYRNAIIVARTPNAAARAMSFAERLRLGIAVIHGDQTEGESDRCDGRNSPPPVNVRKQRQSFTYDTASELIPPGLTTKTKQPMNVVGDVGGKIAIIVDDMIDNVEPLVVAARLLKDRGAFKIYVMATHGILSTGATDLIESSDIDEVVVSNTVPTSKKRAQSTKITEVDISPMLAEAIRRIHNGESMSFLFRDIPLED